MAGTVTPIYVHITPAFAPKNLKCLDLMYRVYETGNKPSVNSNHHAQKVQKLAI